MSMKILVTGATGNVGSKLIPYLYKQGHQIVVLSRNAQGAKDRLQWPIEYYDWNPLFEEVPESAVQEVDAVINLMGEGIANKRWTQAQKKSIRDSRVVSTTKLIKAFQNQTSLKTWVQASAIGFYDNNGQSEVNEDSEMGSGFLSQVCHEWEGCLKDLPDSVRSVILRIGIVLSPEGGALQKMLPPFQAGVGGRLGSGEQYMSWIHVQDLVKLIGHCLEQNNFQGVVNAVSPQVHTNKEFSKILAQVLKRPCLFPVPAFIVRALFGEMSRLVLQGQKVTSKKLDQFEFEFSNLEKALSDLCFVRHFDHLDERSYTHCFEAPQWFDEPVEKLFEYFSDAHNLEKITPPFLKFKVSYQSTPKIQQGTVFTYKLRVRGIPMRWVSLICNWQDQKQFTDTQLKGPYYIWHHTHRFEPFEKGTMMTDQVLFRVPRLPLADLWLAPFIRADVKRIFKYRKENIQIQ